MSKEIIVEFVGPVAKITLNRPDKLNVLSIEMLKQLDDILYGLFERPDLRVLVITGSGERAFSAGADIESFAKQSRESVRDAWVPLGHRILDSISRLPQVVIAALNGSAFGGGLELAMACDIRIARTGSQFALPELSLGTTPGWGGTSRLSSQIGISRAKYLILTGKRIDANTAMDWGLVHEVHAPEDFEMELGKLISHLMDRSPIAMKLAKKLVNAEAKGISSEILEALSASVTATTEDLAEGIEAFMQKRPPKFGDK